MTDEQSEEVVEPKRWQWWVLGGLAAEPLLHAAVHLPLIFGYHYFVYPSFARILLVPVAAVIVLRNRRAFPWPESARFFYVAFLVAWVFSFTWIVPPLFVLSDAASAEFTVGRVAGMLLIMNIPAILFWTFPFIWRFTRVEGGLLLGVLVVNASYLLVAWDGQGITNLPATGKTYAVSVLAPFQAAIGIGTGLATWRVYLRMRKTKDAGGRIMFGGDA